MKRLEAIDACARITVVEPAIIGTHSGGVHRSSRDGACPTHGTEDCVDRFYARSTLADLSLFNLIASWWGWRKAAKR